MLLRANSEAYRFRIDCVMLEQELLILGWVHLERLVLEIVVLNNWELVNIFSNSLRDSLINWSVITWCWTCCTTGCLLCSSTVKLWSKRIAAMWLYLSPVWTSIFLIFAETCCKRAKQWKLWWIVCEERTACRLRLNLTSFNFRLPKSSSFACCNINWYSITHFQML